jgi:hypothetical protein
VQLLWQSVELLRTRNSGTSRRFREEREGSMEVRKSAIDEISRLRLHQSSVESCRNWAYGSGAVFVSLFFTSIPPSYGQFKSAAQIFSLFTLFCSATYIYFSGKPRTTLNKKQMKLLGLSEDDVTHQQAVPIVPGSRSVLYYLTLHETNHRNRMSHVHRVTHNMYSAKYYS